MLAVAQRDLGDGHAAGRLERLAQEVVGLLAELFGLDEVGVLEVEAGLDVLRRHELLDVDRVRGREGKVVEVLVVDDHVSVASDLESFEDLAVADLVLALGAPTLVADGRLVLRAELPERYLGARFRRVVETDWDGDHSERDDAFPHRSRHDEEFTSWSVSPGYFL